MFVRCTVYDLWFNSLCRFCVDWTLCHVVSASNQKMKEQSVSSRFVWRYSFSQLSIRNLGYLVHSILIKYFSVTCCYYHCKNYKQFVGQQLLPLLWLKKIIMAWTVMENISNVEWQSNSAKYFCLKFILALQKSPFINVPL